MILTGRKFEEIAKAALGESWPTRLAKLLRRNRKTMFRWRDEGPPSEVRHQLAQVVEDKIGELAVHYQDLRADSIEG